MTSTFARKILLNNGKPINDRTFKRIKDAGLLSQTGTFMGKPIYDEKDVRKIARFMPKEKIPSRHSIVDYIKEKMRGKR